MSMSLLAFLNETSSRRKGDSACQFHKFSYRLLTQGAFQQYTNRMHFYCQWTKLSTNFWNIFVKGTPPKCPNIYCAWNYYCKRPYEQSSVPWCSCSRLPPSGARWRHDSCMRELYRIFLRGVETAIWWLCPVAFISIWPVPRTLLQSSFLSSL